MRKHRPELPGGQYHWLCALRICCRRQALRLGLLEHGWIEGRNLEIDYRWGGANPSQTRGYAPFCPKADGLSPYSNRQTVVLYSLSLQTRRMHSVCTKALRSAWP